MPTRFQGAITAMVTPFKDGKVDVDRLKANVREQIEGGINGLVPVGTTGESPTLSHDEHKLVVETVVSQAKAVAGNDFPIIAGTGSNATSEAIDLTKHAKAVGADAALVVNPYYNKPTQEGLYRHFSAVADVGLPVVLYNIPGRTAIELSVDTIERLSHHEHVVAVKEATGNLDVSTEIACRTDLTVLSGDDSLTLPIMAVGGRGVISVVSNLVPNRVHAMTDAFLRGDIAEARGIHQELFPLIKALFIETNPVPVKTAMAWLGKDTGDLRLPLCEMAEKSAAALRKVLVSSGLLK